MATPSLAERSVLILGDSLSAAYGIAPEKGWVSLLERRLEKGQQPWRVINASISGETSAGGLARLPKLLDAHSPDLLVIALGSNDALQGKPPALLEKNLTRMSDLAIAAQTGVLIIGNHVPPNYGPEYTRRMFDTYRKVAEEKESAYLPFMLEAVAEEERYFQTDRLHPTAEAQPLILETIWSTLEPLI